MALNITKQSRTIADLFVATGKSGYSGITAAKDGTIATQLDITLSNPYLILADGHFLDADQISATTIGGLSTNGTTHLWADYVSTAGAYAAKFTVATSAPTTTAVKIADVVVATGTISSVTMATAATLAW